MARRRSGAGAWRRARRRPAVPGPGRSIEGRREPAISPSMLAPPSSAITPCSKAGSSVSSARAGPCDARSTPTRGVNTSAGASSPAKRPASTVIRNPAAIEDRQRRIMLEGRLAVALVLRQRDPQLRELEPAWRVRGRFLGVRDAASSGHEVDLARLDPLPVAEAVGVQDRPLDHPAESLQSDVGVRADEQPFPGRKFRRARVVEKAPGADRAPVAVRQRAPDLEAVPDHGPLGFEPLDVHRPMMLRLERARNRA